MFFSLFCLPLSSLPPFLPSFLALILSFACEQPSYFVTEHVQNFYFCFFMDERFVQATSCKLF